jgi:adenylate cyclase
MSLEIERKFLVRHPAWREQATGQKRLCQGYLANTTACSIRVRTASGQGWISVKGMHPGRIRSEYEYGIPESEAKEMLSTLADGPLIEKIRHRVPIGRHCFEIDEFMGASEGLVLAEIELTYEDEEFPRPPWLGDEVTEDARFYNFRLSSRPFGDWPAEVRQAVLQGQGTAGGAS